MPAATAAAAVVPAGTGTPAAEPGPARREGPKRRVFPGDWAPGAYRFTLDLNPGQEARLTRAVGAARVAFNTVLAEVKANLDTRAAEKAQWGAPVTDPLQWSKLWDVWVGVRDDAAPWWGEVSSWAFDTGTKQLAAALKNWSDSRRGTRAGRPVGFPRFRSRRRPGAQSIRVTSHSALKVGAVQGARDNRHIVLPGPLGGQVRTRENLKRLTRRLTAGSAEVTGATISRNPSGRWTVTIHVKQHQPIPGHSHTSPTGAPPSGTPHQAAGPQHEHDLEPAQKEHLEPAAGTNEPAGRSSSSSSNSSSRPSSSCSRGSVVGVDLGVGTQNLMVVADEHGIEIARVENPKALDQVHHRIVALQKKIGRAHRVAVAEGRVDTAGRPVDSQRVLALRARIARLHRRAADIRADAIHKATSGLVAAGHGTIVVETLNVTGMMRRGGARKKGLNRAVADAALGEIGRQVDYKTERAGTLLVHTGRWFPSSKMCSRCAAVKPKLPLAVREYRCDHCGLVIDRDRNAAANLARVGDDPAWETSGWVPAGGKQQATPTRAASPGQGSRHETNNENTTGSGDGSGGSRRKPPSGADGGNGAGPHQGRELPTLTSVAAGAGPHGEGTGTRHGGPRLSHQSQQDRESAPTSGNRSPASGAGDGGGSTGRSR